MTREQWKERLPLIQAFVDGKEIEMSTGHGTWTDLLDIAEFYNRVSEYRLKPQPKLRPWKSEEVPVGASFRYDSGGLPTAWIDTTPTGLFLGLYHHDKETNYKELAENWQHSIDHGKTWLLCGVVE